MDDIFLEDLMASPNHAHEQQRLEASASTTAFSEESEPIPIVPFNLPKHIVRPNAGECRCLWCWRPVLSHQDRSPEMKKISLLSTVPHPENMAPDPKLNTGAPGHFLLSTPPPPRLSSRPNTTLPSVSADESHSRHLFPSKRPPSGVYTATTLSLATNLVPVLVYNPNYSIMGSVYPGSKEAPYEEQRTEVLEEEEEDLLSAFPDAYKECLGESMSSLGSSTLQEVNEGASDSDDDGSVASSAVKSTASLAADSPVDRLPSPALSYSNESQEPDEMTDLPSTMLPDPSRWSASTQPTTPSSRFRPDDNDDNESGEDELPTDPMQLWHWPQPRADSPSPSPSPSPSLDSPPSPSPPPPQPERFLEPRTPPPRPWPPATPPANPASGPPSSHRPGSHVRPSVPRCNAAGGGGGHRVGFRRRVRNAWGKLIGGARRG